MKLGDPTSFRKVTTPGLDDQQLEPEDFETTGQLAGDAVKVIMKALCGARLVRYELLWPICSSARMVSKWAVACDKETSQTHVLYTQP